MANKYADKLRKLEGAILEHTDPWIDPLRTLSPSLNSLYGHTWGAPRGFSTLLWGPPKGGKSLTLKAFVGHLHLTDPEALAIIYDTEYRWKGQLTEDIAASYGIDLDRIIIYEGNKPEAIWDRTEKDLPKVVQDGGKIGLVAIDSVSAVLGRREAESDTITKQQRGDQAMTTQLGLQRILGTQRTMGFHLFLTAQARSEMDPYKVMRGQTVKPAVAFGCQHHCEFFFYVEKNETKAGRKDELGNDFVDPSKKDSKGKEESTGHRIRVWMNDSSMGPKNRNGEFTIDYKKGLVNTHEEVFQLGLRWGVIEKPNNMKYQYKENSWVGKPATLTALAESPELQKSIIEDLMKLDQNNKIQEKTVEEAMKEIQKDISE